MKSRIKYPHSPSALNLLVNGKPSGFAHIGRHLGKMSTDDILPLQMEGPKECVVNLHVPHILIEDRIQLVRLIKEELKEPGRSEERRVGKEGRTRWTRERSEKKTSKR